MTYDFFHLPSLYHRVVTERGTLFGDSTKQVYRKKKSVNVRRVEQTHKQNTNKGEGREAIAAAAAERGETPEEETATFHSFILLFGEIEREREKTG
jgi:hypothetical protein